MAKVDTKFRYTALDGAKIDRAARTIPLSFSSEFPAMQRNDSPNSITRAAGLAKDELYVEVLDHAPENVDLSRLKNRGAFLDEHDDKDQIGVVETAEISAGEKIGRAVVKLDSHEKANTRFSQMESNSRPHISAGYKYTRFIGDCVLPNGRKAKRFAWAALELSSVAVPADPTIGVSRSNQDFPELVDSPETVDVSEIAKKLTPEEKKRMKLLLSPEPAEGTLTVADVTKARGDAQTAERTRVKQISTAADELTKRTKGHSEKIRKMASDAIESGEELVSFQNRAMTDLLSAVPQRGELTSEEMGVSERQAGEYSIMRGIQSVINRAARGNNVPDGFEGEMHQEMVKREKDAGNVVKYDGFVIPPWAKVRMDTTGRKMSRDLTAGVFGQGGATVATQLQVPIIEILRNKLVTSTWGVRTMSGLSGNIVVPRHTGASQAYSVAETAALTLSTQVLDQIALAPKRLGVTNNYSKQLLLQSSIDVENFVRDDAMKVLAIDMDRLILNGSGAGSEMLGIMQTVGIGSVTFGAAATFAKLVSFETLVAAQNVMLEKGTTSYITTPTAKGTLKSAAKLLTGATTVAAEALWQNDEINGYRADASNQIPGNLMLFGDASQFLVGIWGGIDVVVDPYTLAKNGEVAITWNAFMDGTCRHPQAFCLSTDSAAQ